MRYEVVKGPRDIDDDAGRLREVLRRSVGRRVRHVASSSTSRVGGDGRHRHRDAAQGSGARRCARSGLAADCVLFVDGVRRIDARVWIDGDRARHLRVVRRGRGAVRRAGRRSSTSRSRGACSAPRRPHPTSSRPRRTYPARMAASSDIAGLMLAVHERMADVRGAARKSSGRRRRPHRDRRTVAGPRPHRPCRRVHQEPRRALSAPRSCTASSARSPPGSARPCSRSASTWSRHSWYLRLPGPSGSPWSGIVRCECSPDLAPAAAVTLANTSDRGAAAVRVRAPQGHPGAAEPVSDRRPRARAAAPAGRSGVAVPQPSTRCGHRLRGARRLQRARPRLDLLRDPSPRPGRRPSRSPTRPRRGTRDR